MTNNSIKLENDLNPTYTIYSGTMHPTMTNMSVVPQISTRPTTLPLNTQHVNNHLLFTPNDHDKFSLSTPDIINALSTQVFSDGQSSSATRVIDDMFNTSMTNIHYQHQSVQPSTHPHHHDMHQLVSNTIHQQPEPISTYRTDRTTSQISSSRDRSISSSMNEHDSSNSTAPSSPTGSYVYSNRVKDELQHVPSTHSNGPVDVVKKERKRERNRQAAQKCRTRKLTRIAELQKRVNELQGKNKDLTGIAETLKTDITKLEKQLQDHHTQGCTLMNGSVL